MPDERPAPFSHPFLALLTLRAAGGPGGSQRGQVEMEIQNRKTTRRDLSDFTTESFVWTLVPIGMEYQSSPRVLSHLPATQPSAESRRPGFKSILIGAPIPYAERPSARSHGELRRGPRLHQF